MATRTKPAPIAMSIAEAATSLGISEQHARNLAHAGEIPTIQLGGRTVIPVCWIESQVEQALEAWRVKQGVSA